MRANSLHVTCTVQQYQTDELDHRDVDEVDRKYGKKVESPTSFLSKKRLQGDWKAVAWQRTTQWLGKVLKGVRKYSARRVTPQSHLPPQVLVGRTRYAARTLGIRGDLSQR